MMMGEIALELTLAGLPQGGYSLAAYGAWTKFTAAGAFQVR